MNVEDEIQDIVREINEAWLERPPADLARFLHDEIVIAPPGLQGRVQGRRAAVDSYEQFAEAAAVHAADFDEWDTIGVWAFRSSAPGDRSCLVASFGTVCTSQGPCGRCRRPNVDYLATDRGSAFGRRRQVGSQRGSGSDGIGRSSRCRHRPGSSLVM
jgi:hypothetical protein